MGVTKVTMMMYGLYRTWQGVQPLLGYCVGAKTGSVTEVLSNSRWYLPFLSTVLLICYLLYRLDCRVFSLWMRQRGDAMAFSAHISPCTSSCSMYFMCLVNDCAPWRCNGTLDRRQFCQLYLHSTCSSSGQSSRTGLIWAACGDVLRPLLLAIGPYFLYFWERECDSIQ